MDLRSDLLERFLRYVRVNTQSKDGVEDRFPSTECQLDLARLLEKELAALGLEDVRLDSHGYLFATLPARLPPSHARRVPTVGLLAHLDTYPAVPGDNVQPILHENYSGGPIQLPKAPDLAIRPEDNPELSKYLGDTIITSDGSTLLGGDDKAGIAVIMSVLRLLVTDPKLVHPRLRVAFTPDEEVGNGTKYFDIQAFGADLAYTLDGGGMGEVEDETFSADSASVIITGSDVHPGYAKGKMVNAVRLAQQFIARLPWAASPETTEGRAGYLHPYQVNGSVSEARIQLLVRDFTEEGLKRLEERLRDIAADVLALEPRAKVAVEVKESYRNMKTVLDRHPQVVEFAEEAVRRVGLTPQRKAIRGGTDGSRLSLAGLPTPNLSAGGYNFHSRQEWVALSAMVRSAQVVRELLGLWVERGLTAGA
ncbi:MAG: peptidase T [Myxococcales bacterium]|nr:peptidase T [Myxococcales bacterium]